MFTSAIKVHDNDVLDTASTTNNIDDVAQISTELNLTLIKRENRQQFRPVIYSKATVNRTVEFHKLRPVSSQKKMTSSKKDVPINIPVMHQLK